MGEWVAPEIPEIDRLMKAADAQALADGDPMPTTLEAIRNFVSTEESQHEAP